MSISRTGPSADDKPLLPIDNTEVNLLPDGTPLITDPNSWYRLKATYIDKNGKPATGYAYPLAANASTSFWDYMVLGSSSGTCPPLEFKLDSPDDSGYQRWNIRDNDCNDGYHLDCKATGWLYRASAYDTKFRIVDKKLYMNYRWKTAVGSEWRDGFGETKGQYVGADLPEITCELEKVS
jgi:hypothetical protein